METRKIAVACFIGGALTVAVALALTPQYWWFGLMAGIAGGYISYEFREVLKAIPVAFRAATSWHPPQHYWAAVGWTMLAMSSAMTWIVGIFVVGDMVGFTTVAASRSYGEWVDEWLRVYSILLMILGGYSLLFYGALLVKASSEYNAFQTKTFRMVSYYISPPLVFFWHLPRGIVWMLRRFPRVAVAFAWHLFKLIHSQKRVLCAIDGSLGGATSYIWLVPASATLAEQAMLVVCGGLLGSTFGMVNWEIVSKRILHLPEAEIAQA